MFQDITCPATYVGGGLFQTNEVWRHPTRTMGNYEIIVMTAGTAYLYVGDHRMTVKPGEAVLFPPKMEHGSWKESSGETAFYWCHFDMAHSLEEPLVNPCKLLDETRMLMLCRQLLHTENAPAYPPYAVRAAFELMYSEFMQACQTANVSSRLVCEVAEWVRVHAEQNLTAAAVAVLWGYHPDYMSTIFRKFTGRTLKQYICDERIKMIKTMLYTSTYSLKQIAAKMEFPSEKHLIHFFHYHEGMSPIAYRNMHPYTHLNKK